MDDLIVIILTVIVATFGILGQIKKKKAGQSNVSQPNKPGSFWDLLQEEPPFPEEQFQADELKSEPADNAENYMEQPAYNFSAENEGGYIKKMNPKPKISEGIKESKMNEKFSLRKAVIYSEILNRKYT